MTYRVMEVRLDPTEDQLWQFARKKEARKQVMETLKETRSKMSMFLLLKVTKGKAPVLVEKW